jgi:hypothetical protein
VGARAEFLFPTSVAVDSYGELYIADSCGVRKVSLDGVVSVVAQPGGSSAVTVDAAGNIIFITGSHIRKVAAGGTISTIGGIGTPGYSGDGGPALSAAFDRPTGIAVNAAGDVYVADAYNHVIRVLRVKTETVE